jgi:hypothetical protein
MASPSDQPAASPQSQENHNESVNHQVSEEGNHVQSNLNQQSIPLRPKSNTHTSNSETQKASEPSTIKTSKEENKHDDDSDNEENKDSHLEGDYGEITNLPPPTELAKKKKRNKKRKPASQRGSDKPTGFEDFFADAPLTPEQHAEERELYDPGLHFIDRILVAIGRFERTRKMSPERRDILYKYLSYGNVECGPNMFQGGQDLTKMDKSTIANILTNASITEEKRDLETETSLYAVDFLGCMKGFLSRHAARLYGFDQRDQLDRVTSTLERFMNYLLQHDVCPEYSAEILETRNFCRYDANAELWAVAEATRRLPGDFNRACSTLFGGQYAENYDGETWWGPEEIAGSVFVGLKPEEASQILHFGVAGAAREDVFAFYLEAVNGGKTLEVVSVEEATGLEITRVEPPTSECKEVYTRNSKHFRPVGRVYARPWKNPDAPPEDLTDEERWKLEKEYEGEGEKEKEQEYVFFLESIIQEDLRVGMKLEATVRTLNCGLMYFDEFLTLYPSFDTYLANEAMVGWKKPRPLKGAFDYIEEETEDHSGGMKNGNPAGIDDGSGGDDNVDSENPNDVAQGVPGNKERDEDA